MDLLLLVSQKSLFVQIKKKFLNLLFCKKNLFAGLLRLPVTLVPVFLVDRLGRRPLIIGSTAVSFLSLLTMMIGIEMGADWKVI